MELIKLSNKYYSEFKSMAYDYSSIEDYRYYNYCNGDFFKTFLAKLKMEESEKSVPYGLVPSESFWLLFEKQLVGSIRYRSNLTKELYLNGGHIGFDISPRFRNRGFATIMLSLLLKNLKKQQIKKVLITSVSTNVEANRVIVKCGGHLEDTVKSENIKINRYWIDLSNFMVKEFWDLYDSNGKLLPQKAIRDNRLKPNQFHLVTSLWIKNSKNEYLVSIRSSQKNGAGMYETVAGSAKLGDSSVTSVIREAEEEIGISISKDELCFIERIYNPDSYASNIFDIYMIKKDIEIKDLVFQKEEVASASWKSFEEVNELLLGNNFFKAEIYRKIIDKI